MISHITKIEGRKKKGYMVIKIFLLIEFFYSMGTQENKNLHVKLPNVATWLKWSEFFTCWEIRPIYYIWLYELRNQKLISFSFFYVFQLKFIFLFYFFLDCEIYHLWDCLFVRILQAFFQRWWSEQSEEIQSIVKKLVSSGQLELM